MKVALFLFLFCLAEADDLRYEVKALFQQLKNSMEERLSHLEGQHADMASRLSVSESKMEELVEELQKHKADKASRLFAMKNKMEEPVEEVQKHEAGGQDIENNCCYTGDGRDYRGEVSWTISGKICQSWSAQRPHNHNRTPENHPLKGLDNNYCRNPDGEKSPWCYTTHSTRWEYCPVPTCEVAPGPALPCYTGDGSDYRGTVASTKSGKSCQSWSAQTPHKHVNTPINFPCKGLDSNYCRNPDGEESPWCYTTDSETRWQYCPVPTCDA